MSRKTMPRRSPCAILLAVWLAGCGVYRPVNARLEHWDPDYGYRPKNTQSERQVGDILAAGSEEAVARRLRAFADAGATDVSIRIVPIGETRDELIASRDRTRAYLSSLQGQL